MSAHAARRGGAHRATRADAPCARCAAQGRVRWVAGGASNPNRGAVFCASCRRSFYTPRGAGWTVRDLGQTLADPPRCAARLEQIRAANLQAFKASG